MGLSLPELSPEFDCISHLPEPFGRVPRGCFEGLDGPLPSALSQACHLKSIAIACQRLEGGIPSLTSTLSLLALHKNHLKVLPDLHFEDNRSTTAILLHDNLLSCHVPWCGNAAASTSIIAIGNRLRHPKGEFPAWVSKYEHDPLFWDSGIEGVSLLRMISGAAGSFTLVIAWKLDKARWLIAMSRWPIGPLPHLRLVRASSHLVSCLVRESLLAVVFLIFLLHWDLYTCPQTLAIASACLRSSALLRSLVFLHGCRLSFHSLAVDHLTMEGKNKEKQLTAQMLRKRLLVWLQWCVLTVVFSTIAILYQVSRSIPGFLPAGKIFSLGLKACVGSTQGVIGNIIMPFLASKVTWDKHVFTRVSNLITNCLIPAAVIMYLDTGCLGRWVLLWKPCQSNRQLFQHSFICNAANRQDCKLEDGAELDPDWGIDMAVTQSSDICDPQASWNLPSCIHILLLRLQPILVAKFVTSGIVIPGTALLRKKLPDDSGAVLGNFAIYMAYAMVSSGHLPLMMPMLLIAFLAEELVARVSWAEGHLGALCLQNVAALEDRFSERDSRPAGSAILVSGPISLQIWPIPCKTL